MITDLVIMLGFQLAILVSMIFMVESGMKAFPRPVAVIILLLVLSIVSAQCWMAWSDYIQKQ